MSAGGLVYALVAGGLIALAAHAIEGIARARRWPTRWIWAASMAGTIAVIVSAVVPPSGAVPDEIMARGATVGTATAVSTTSTLALMLRDLRTMAESAMVAGVATLTRQLPAWLGGAVGALWLACAFLALATLAFVHQRLRRARRSWPAVELHGRRVRVAPTVGPAVVGIVRPEIVVPRWLLEREEEEQRLVLAHEDEHVRANDHLLLGGACVAVALMPWHPGAWWTLARLRLAIELDCDARVLRRGVPPRSYGEMLIDLAGQCSGFRVGATALADKTSHLERRLLAMRPTPTRYSLVRIGALCAAAVLSLVAACEARVPTSSEIEAMDVAGAERLAAKTAVETMQGATAPEFYVNGVKVSAAEAHAITPNDIAAVNVEKSKAGAAATVIRVTTVAATADGAKYRTGDPAVEARASDAMVSRKALHEKMTLSNRMFEGVFLIDGTRADAAALHRLDPKDIAGIEVVKGAAAMQMSTDPAAKNGIIKVTTKGRRTTG